MMYATHGLSVFIGMPVNRDVPYQTMQSLCETIDMLHKRHIDYEIQILTGSALVEKARSKLAHLFLQSQANRMFWLDSDMAWTADSFYQVFAKTVAMDIVGATYRTKTEQLCFALDVGPGPHRTNEHGCLPVLGMGLGFTCCRREVIECLAKHAPIAKFDDEDVPMIFRSEVKDGVFRGEDMVFFEDCRKAGAGVWCDPSIELGHVGGFEYRGALADRMKQVV